MEKKLYLYQAAEVALHKIGGPARLNHILDTIKENRLFEFGTKDPNAQIDNLAKSMKKNPLILKVKPGIYELSSKHVSVNYNIESTVTKKEKQRMNKKIFISHSTDDKEYASEIISLLLEMRVPSGNIRCSSLYPYGVGAGEDIFNWMKTELNDEAVVICLLSKNYYSSYACAAELGAAWILSKTYIPILIPPTNFKDIEGMPQSTKAIKIDDKYEFNYVKDAIVKHLELSFDELSWEGIRDRFINRISMKQN